MAAIPRKLVQVTLALCLSLFASAAFAQLFVPDKAVMYAGQSYLLTSQEPAGGYIVYHYNRDKESAGHWTTRMTIIYEKGADSDPKQWLGGLLKLMLSRQAVPQYNMDVQGDHGYAQILYSPDGYNVNYVLDIIKTYHGALCGGSLAYIYSVRYPKGGDQSEEGQGAQRYSILKQSIQFAHDMERDGWLPGCYWSLN